MINIMILLRLHTSFLKRYTYTSRHTSSYTHKIVLVCSGILCFQAVFGDLKISFPYFNADLVTNGGINSMPSTEQHVDGLQQLLLISVFGIPWLLDTRACSPSHLLLRHARNSFRLFRDRDPDRSE